MNKRNVLLLVAFNSLISFVYSVHARPAAFDSAFFIVSPGQSIQEAINSVGDGAEILVQSGVYYENVIVNKSIILRGENSLTTIIDGNGVGNVLTITASNVFLENFTIEKGDSSESNKGSGVRLSRVTNVSISNCVIRNSYYGVYLFESNYARISYNLITNNTAYGMYFSGSSNNSMVGNTIANHPTGVSIATDTSRLNKFYHNNFIDNTHIIIWAQTIWDDGYPSGGNYWNDYEGVDEKSGPNQDENGPDGIGDTRHPWINDRYPLMAPLSIFEVKTWNDTTHRIYVISKSKISYFQFSIAEKILSFNVTGAEFTNGFCRIVIPSVIVQYTWGGDYAVLLNGEACSFKNWTDAVNTYIYVSYSHPECQLTIIPEFMSVTLLQLFIIITIFVAILSTKRKFQNRMQ